MIQDEYAARNGRVLICLSVIDKRRCSPWPVSGTVSEQTMLQTMASWQEQVRCFMPGTIIEASCKPTGSFLTQLEFQALNQFLKTGKQVYLHLVRLPYGLTKLALLLVVGPNANLRSSQAPAPVPQASTTRHESVITF